MTGFRIAGMIALATGLTAPAHAGISSVGVYIQQNFFQDSGGVAPWSSRPTALQELDDMLGGNAKIAFTVATATQAQGLGATLTLPGSSTALPLTFSSNWNDPSYHFDYNAEGYASLAQLLAAHPDGAYRFHAPAAGSSGQAATLNFNGTALKNSAIATAIPTLTNYASLQGMKAGSNFSFSFNAFQGFGSSSGGQVHPYTQVGIFDLAARSVVYVSPYLTSSSTSFVLGANTLQSGTDYAYFVNFDSWMCTGGPLCGGHEIGNYTLGTFSTAPGPAVPQTLVNFQGGTQDAPVELPRVIDQIGAVSGTIGGAPDVDFYKFVWGGGSFAATATLTGADPSAEFTFKLIDFASGTVLGRLTLDQEHNNFNGTLSEVLAPGVYVIGLISGASADPAFTISFDTSGMSAAVPEPASWVFLLCGLLPVVAAGTKKARLREPSAASRN